MQQTLTSQPQLRDPQPAAPREQQSQAELVTLDPAAAVRSLSIADTAIAEMREKYMPLLIRSVEDTAGFHAVHEARMVVKAHRVKVEKTRQQLKADALAYGRTVDSEAKRITALLEPIETHLAAQEENYNQQRAKLKAARLQARVDKLQAVEASVPIVTVEAMDDAHFDLLLAQKTEEFQARKEQERLAAEQRARREAEEAAARKAEEERLAAERQRQVELEAERRREEEARLQAEREKLEAERKALEEQQRLQREEQARIEAERRRIELEEANRVAAEKARLETEHRLQREREAAERAAKEQAEREEQQEREAAEAKARAEALRPDREKLRPDREKLRAWVSEFRKLQPPEVSEDAIPIRRQIVLALLECEKKLREFVHDGFST